MSLNLKFVTIIDNTYILRIYKLLTLLWIFIGSFYLVTKSEGRVCHAFEITQKLDKIVLESIGHLLGIKVIKKKHISQLVLLMLNISLILFYTFIILWKVWNLYSTVSEHDLLIKKK